MSWASSPYGHGAPTHSISFLLQIDSDVQHGLLERLLSRKFARACGVDQVPIHDLPAAPFPDVGTRSTYPLQDESFIRFLGLTPGAGHRLSNPFQQSSKITAGTVLSSWEHLLLDLVLFHRFRIDKLSLV
jgi:hypothetical protein